MGERVKTGIIGLDQIIGGGLPENYCYLVLGGPGAGKTTFGIQYLVNGILSGDRTGVYVSFNEPPISIIMNAMNNFGWDLLSLEAKMKLAVVDASPIQLDTAPKALKIQGALGMEDFSIDSVLGRINEARRRVTPAASICVIDCISDLMFQYEHAFEQRKEIMRLVKGLTEMRLTTVLLGELLEETIDFQKFGPEAFLAQGVFVLHNIRAKNNIVQVFQIRKLRGQEFNKGMMPYSITKYGVEIYPDEKVFV